MGEVILTIFQVICGILVAFFTVVWVVTAVCYFKTQKWYREVVIPEMIKEDNERMEREKAEKAKWEEEYRKKVERWNKLEEMGICPEGVIILGGKNKHLIPEAEARKRGMIE